MDSLQYVKLATMAPVRYNGSRVNLCQFMNALQASIRALTTLEACKREMFCENGYSEKPKVGFANTCSALPGQFEDVFEGQKVMSAILNIACESMELLKKLEQTLKNKDYVSVCGIHDASANLFQHQAVLANFLDTTFEEMMISSAETLKAIYPEKYSIDKQVEIAMLKSEGE